MRCRDDESRKLASQLQALDFVLRCLGPEGIQDASPESSLPDNSSQPVAVSAEHCHLAEQLCTSLVSIVALQAELQVSIQCTTNNRLTGTT